MKQVNLIRSFSLAFLFHVLVGVFLFVSFSLERNQASMAEELDIIDAIVLDEDLVNKTVQSLKRTEQEKKMREIERIKESERALEQLKKERAQEAEKIKALKEKQQEELQKLAETQKQAQAQKAEADKLVAKALDKKKKIVENQKKKELALMQEKKKKEAQKLKEAEEKKIAEQKQKKLAEKKSEETKRLSEKDQAEKRRSVARKIGIMAEVDRYSALIRQKVQQNWFDQPSFSGNARVQVKTNPATGEVLSVLLVISSGNPTEDESFQRAIFRSSPLPLPVDPEAAREFASFSFSSVDF